MEKVKNFFGNIKNAFTADFSRQVEDNKKKYGNYVLIDQVLICRNPVEKTIKNLVNYLSFGKVKKEAKKLGYDDLYHLFSVLKLKNPNNNDIIYMKIEKNQTININVSQTNSFDAKESIKYELDENKQDLTFSLLMYLMEQKMKDKFTTYDPITNNCQVFIYNLLHIINKYMMGLDTLQDYYKNFIMQSADKLLENSPIASKFSKGITKTAGFFTRLIGGEIDVSEYDNFY